MTTSAILPTDQEEAAELAALLGDLPPLENESLSLLSAGEFDALASEALRKMGIEERELARYEEALSAEVRHIKDRYNAAVNSVLRRRDALRGYVEELARRADFGKKKSRDVGFGTYGRRTIPEKIVVTEEEKAIASLRQYFGDEALREEVSIDMKEARKRVLAVAHETGEVLPGFDVEFAKDVPFAKPDLGTA